MDDYGYGKCPDAKRCNVFPDRRPFPQTNDWRRRSYVYVWHTLGGSLCRSFFPLLNVASCHLISHSIALVCDIIGLNITGSNLLEGKAEKTKFYLPATKSCKKR